ncbi:related to DNA mismatch repair protein MSH2 [Saccharomycodes ludwigii]|uniref:Related to DNA mismatch repair protein MSH2 n=1 Tax=Saccharomycodes ludwigii TaxID=36035 RepID=A0A376BBN6_9ASCO|nr:related to DNA mismatch repair protein MSH2 [Saccharomycodes ludwigii]
MTSIRPELRFTDIAEERGFYKRFLTLPEKPENIIRIADRGEYYTIVGEDAQFAAQQVYHTSSVLKKANCLSGNENSEPLTYVTMSQQVCLQFLKMCLFEYGYKIEIYDKSWKIIKRASPGNIEQIDDLLSVSIDSSIVLCSLKFQNNLNEGNSTIGCSFVDSSIYKLGMIELLDNEVYSNLESLIIQLGAKECLVPDLRENISQKKELEKITRVIDRCGCVVTFVKPSDFTDKDVDQDIVRLVGDELTLALPKYSKLCLSACNALLIYLNLMGETKNYGKYELIEHSLNQYMKLDASSLRALNIFPQGPSQSIATAGSSNHTKINSVFQLLNKCKTHSGVRLLHEWLKQPLLDLDELNKRHDLVEFLIDQLELRQILRDNYLPHVPDVRRITKKLNMKANLDEVLKLYTFVDKLPMIASTIKEYVADCGTNHTANIILEEWYGPLEKEIEPLSNFKKMVEDTIDLDHYEKYNEAIINCEAEEQLSLCKGKLDQHLAEVEDLHSSVAEDLGTDDKRLKLEKHHLYGWCFRLTRNDAKVLRGKTEHRYYELSTVKAGVYFTTKDLERISKEIEQLEQQYDALQKELVAEVVAVALTYTPVLERISMILANVDVLCSFAHVSSYAPIPYVRPTMLSMTEQDTRKLILQNSRHPVLEVQDDVSFISNDVKMERGTRDFLIITGPNMGGKSTYIRQIGVIVLMAQVGCFVPCDDAQISIMDSILCRVGAGDSQFKGYL